MRVIAGVARGQRLRAPSGSDIRPTADRVREALFSSLAGQIEGAVVLDLYAGAGTLGVEALSRGAERVVFVERDRTALAALRGNLARTGLEAGATVVAAEVSRFCAAPRGGPFDVVLADPPYAVGLARVYEVLDTLARRDAVTAGATVVVERDRRDPELELPPPPPLARERLRTYGDTALLYLRASRERGEETGWA